MALLYVVQFAFVAMALGLLGYAARERFGLGGLTSAGLAATLTPHALAVSVLLIALVWPGAPSMVFLCAPGAIALVSIVLQRRSLGAFLARSGSVLRSTWVATPWTMTAVSACSIFLLLRLSHAVDVPLIGHDALVYLNEAKAFAQHRTIASIPGFDAALGEAVKAHPHLFFWSAYIAQPLMATGGSLGYPNDIVAHGAMLLTLPLMVAGVVALAASAGARRSAWIALPLVLLLQQLGYIPTSGSVDAFRTIPIIAAIAMVLGMTNRRGVIPLPAMAALGFLIGAGAASHTINLIYIGLLLGCLWLFAVLKATAPANALLASVAAMVFLLPTVIYFAVNHRRYGRPFGLGFDYYFYPGTPLWEPFSNQSSWTITHSIFEAIWQFSQIHGPASLGLGLLSAAVVLARAARERALDRPAGLAIIFLVMLLVPLVNVGNGVTLQGAMISNQRYGLTLMCVTPAVIATMFEAIGTRRSPATTRSLKLIEIAVYVSLSMLAVRAVGNWAFDSKDVADTYLANNELFVADVADQLPENASWAVDRYTPAYFADRLPIKLASSLGREILAAPDIPDAVDALNRLHVRMVAIHEWDWWKKTALAEVLRLHPEFEVKSDSSWRVFVLPDGLDWNAHSG
jgi:hypothetical protein